MHVYDLIIFKNSWLCNERYGLKTAKCEVQGQVRALGRGFYVLWISLGFLLPEMDNTVGNSLNNAIVQNYLILKRLV